MVRFNLNGFGIVGIVYLCLLGGELMYTTRPYFNLKSHDLYILVAKELGAKRTDKKTLKLVLLEMDFRKSDKSNRLKEFLTLYFKHLPR